MTNDASSEARNATAAAISDASANRPTGLLSAACADARMRVTDLLNAIPVLGPNIEHASFQHAAIVEAVLAADPEAAVAEHLEGTAALLRGFLG